MAEQPVRRRFDAKTLVRVALGFLILAFVLSRIDLDALTLRWDSRATTGFILCIAIIAGGQLLSALRWRLVLGDEGSSFTYLLRLYLISLFFSLFLPTSVGGDAVRAVAISRSSRRPAWAVSSIVFERRLGLVAMFLLLAVGAMLTPAVFKSALERTSLDLDFSPLQIAIAITAAAIIGIVALRFIMRHPKFRSIAVEAGALWTSFRDRPGAFGAALVVSVLVQGAYIIAWYVLAIALRMQVPAVDFLVFVPFVSIAAMLPVTVAGIGLREGAAALLLAQHGIVAADAVAYSLLYFAAFLIIGVAGGVAFAVMGTGRRDTRDEQTSSTARNSTAESVSQL